LHELALRWQPAWLVLLELEELGMDRAVACNRVVGRLSDRHHVTGGGERLSSVDFHPAKLG